MELSVQREDIILLGDFELVCFTLNNDQRVFSHTRLLNILMADYTNLNLHRHLSVLIPFLPFAFIERKIRISIVFMYNDRRVRGIEYEDFKILCKAFINANEQGKLPSRFFLMLMLSQLFQAYDEKQHQY